MHELTYNLLLIAFSELKETLKLNSVEFNCTTLPFTLLLLHKMFLFFFGKNVLKNFKFLPTVLVAVIIEVQ